MAVLTTSAFYSKWTTRFADNTSRVIDEGDLREFAEDIKDSVNFDAGLNWAVIEIGDWDMNATSTVSIAHGLTMSSIRSVSVHILPDSGANLYPIDYMAFAGSPAGGYSIVATNVVLTRETGGSFDSTSFDSTSFNRGYITISYV